MTEADPTPQHAPGPELVRLNKLLAERGVGARRKCDEVIASGAVTVDGEVVRELGTRVDPWTARISVNGRPLPTPRRVVYALHKPRGVVCTSAPGEKRTRAVDLVLDPGGARLFCVGRLDADSEGLILLTNDGDFAQRVSHPRYGVSKTYFVKVRGRIDAGALVKASQGVRLSEGKTSGAKVWVRKRLATASVLLVTIREGMNREIRRIFAQVGFPVISLKRVAIGSLSVKGLRLGHYRLLPPGELKALLASGAGAEDSRKGASGKPARRAPRELPAREHGKRRTAARFGSRRPPRGGA